MDELIGTTLAGYAIETCVGRGGMGAVYRARENATGRYIALKVLLSEEGGTSEAKLRFKRETAIHLELSHPNVVQVYDAGVEGDHEFLVLELVEGQTLYEHIENFSPLSDDFVLKTARGIALALAYLHERNIIHRDLKPKNVLISKTGEVKVADFGLSKMLHRTQLTRAGQFLGTLYYAAPEVMAGVESRTPADVYSLGACLYEMVSGKKPYEADDIQGMLRKFRRSSPTPLAKLAPGLSPELERLVDKCLERDPDDRPTATEVAAQLDALATGRPVPKPAGAAMGANRTGVGSAASAERIVARLPSSDDSDENNRAIRQGSPPQWLGGGLAPPLVAPETTSGRDSAGADSASSRGAKILAVIIALCAIGAAGWFVANNFSAARRMAQGLHNPDPAIRRQVAAAMGDAPPSPEVAQILAENIGDSDAPVRKAIARSFAKVNGQPREFVHNLLEFARSNSQISTDDLADLLETGAPVQGVSALLDELHGAPTPVAPRWIEILDRISKVSPETGAQAGDDLASAEPNLGRALCRLLGRSGTAGARATPTLQRLVDDNTCPIRGEALAALFAVAPSPEVHAAVMSALKDSDPAVMLNAARALTSQKSRTQDELEALIGTLGNPDFPTTAQIQKMICSIYPAFADRPESIALALVRQDAAAHQLAEAQLAKERDADAAEQTRQELQDLVSFNQDSVNQTTSTSSSVPGDELARVAFQSKLVSPILQKCLQSADPSIRQAATMELGRLGTGAGTVVSTLIDLVANDSVPAERVRAAQTLGAIGPSASSAQSTLQTAILKGTPELQQVALVSLGQIVSLYEPVVSNILGRLGTTDPFERHAVIKVLSNPSQSNLLGVIVDRLQSDQAVVRDAAIEILGRRGDQSKDSLAAINFMANHDNEPNVRQRAVWALGRIAPRSDVTQETCTNLLHDDVIEVRLNAAAVVLKFGSTDGRVVANEVLAAAVRDPAPGVRRRVATILKAVHGK